MNLSALQATPNRNPKLDLGYIYLVLGQQTKSHIITLDDEV